MKKSSRFSFSNLTGLLPILLILQLSGCGDSGSSTERVYVPMYAPQQVTLDGSSANSLTVSWTNAANADSYKLYIASENITDPGNIAALADGAEIDNVTSPYTINNLTTGTHYFILVTAMYGTHESVANNALEATPMIAGRYLPIDDNGTYNPDGTIIRDYANDLDWQRCPYGMSWNATSNQCEGTADDYYDSFTTQILQNVPTTAQFAKPTISQLLTLVYCDGDQTFFNGETLDQTCTSSTDPTVYPGLFTGMPTDLVYGSQTVLAYRNTPTDGLFVNFGNATVEVQDATTYFCNNGTVYIGAGIKRYTRLVRLVARPR